jgi:hypothetical protein
MAGSSWPSLISGRTAKASEVEAKFDWLEGDVVPMSGGSLTDSVYYLGTSGARWLGVYTRSINPTSTAGGIGIGTTTAMGNAMLDINGNGALVIPRVTTVQRDLWTPANGMLIYNTTAQQFQKYENGAWRSMGGTVIGAVPRAATTTTYNGAATQTTNLINYSGAGRIRSLLAGCAGGTGDNIIGVVIDGFTLGTLSAVATATAYRPSSENSTTALAFTAGAASIDLDMYFKNTLQIYARQSSNGADNSISRMVLDWEHD